MNNQNFSYIWLTVGQTEVFWLRTLPRLGIEGGTDKRGINWSWDVNVYAYMYVSLGNLIWWDIDEWTHSSLYFHTSFQEKHVSVKHAVFPYPWKKKYGLFIVRIYYKKSVVGKSHEKWGQKDSFPKIFNAVTYLCEGDWTRNIPVHFRTLDLPCLSIAFLFSSLHGHPSLHNDQSTLSLFSPLVRTESVSNSFDPHFSQYHTSGLKSQFWVLQWLFCRFSDLTRKLTISLSKHFNLNHNSYNWKLHL